MISYPIYIFAPDLAKLVVDEGPWIKAKTVVELLKWKKFVKGYLMVVVPTSRLQTYLSRATDFPVLSLIFPFYVKMNRVDILD